MHAHGFLENALVFLLAVVIAVPLFNRLKLGAVLAYLVAGALIGPHVLKLVDPQGEALAVSELGVVLLLFLIGLEVSYARLWLMRRLVFAVGSLQVLITAAAIAAICLLLGQDWRIAAVAAIALAMSSTAIGVQLLAERRELNHAHGRTALAVLLFQDLVAIPAIALLPLLGAAAASTEIGSREVLIGLGKVVAALAAVYVAGRYGVRPLLRWVASTHSVEAFTATTLLIVLGTAQLTALAGLSLALGAFLAGLLLAESEYRHEIEANLEPFKGLLLGLFFVGVGLTVDWQFVGAHAAQVLACVAGLLLLKSSILYALGRFVARQAHADSLKLAALLAQGGEFAFVLLSLAAGSRLLAPGERDLSMAIVVLSMAATPLLVRAADRLLASTRTVEKRPFDEIPDHETPRVIIAGFGRMGQIVGRVLHASRIPFVALEHSAEQVDTLRRFGNRIYYGDPSRPELLRAARTERAELFVLATDDPEANLRTARIVKRLYPNLKIHARARNRQHAFRLLDMQVDSIVRETFFSSLVLARQVLEGLGLSAEQAASRIERFREHDERMLRVQHLVYDDETQLIQSAHDARIELEQLFEADLAAETAPPNRDEHASRSRSFE